MPSAQGLSEQDRRVLALWAADCAERVLAVFETAEPDDDRPADAIRRAREFGRGERSAAGEIRIRFVAGRAARAGLSGPARAAARAAAQAAGVAHMGAHALGAAAYAVRAVALRSPGTTAQDDEIAWQLQHLTAEQRTALRLLPPLGQDRGGPLGPGLLASGDLGATIRRLQAGLGPAA
ncbi:putative immunity protein [Amnibacterium sp.]|uniref:putative immunity protein n=1 Tax=Amnibacterium sp. TaxID=1872496 RepID=UPI003F7B4EE9